MATRTREGYWIVRWSMRGKKTVRVFRSKKFKLDQFEAMTEFMADKVDLYGLGIVWLAYYDKLGRKVYDTRKKKGFGTPDTRSVETRAAGRFIKLAASIQEEDFGSFAQLC